MKMRTLFTLSLMGSFLGLVYVGEASAWGRHRSVCCMTPPPSCAPQVCSSCAAQKLAGDGYGTCTCTGTVGCTIDCPGSCYWLKDENGVCSCGCGHASWGPPYANPRYHVPAGKKFRFHADGMTWGDFVYAFYADSDPGHNVPVPDASVINNVIPSDRYYPTSTNPSDFLTIHQIAVAIGIIGH